MSQLTLALHHASLCCLWYGVNGKQRMSTRELNPVFSNLFPTDRSYACKLCPDFRCCHSSILQSQSNNLRYSHGVVLLEGPVLALLSTLMSWILLLLLVLQSLHYSQLSVWCALAPHAYDSTFHKVVKMTVICPFTSSEHAVFESLPEKV